MPIFFHLESHLWIAYLFFVNGFLINSLVANRSNAFRDISSSFESSLVAAFATSLCLNTLLLYCATLFEIRWEQLGYVFLILSIIILGFMLYDWLSKKWLKTYEFGFARCIFYSIVFTVLFFNGGLVEQVSDAWWHMSLANKMGYESLFDLPYGHLDGVYSRSYPPLWHANLALVSLLSSEPLVVIWNSFTAWGAVLKVMAFYLMGFALTKNRAAALIGCILFFFLPGLGPSYMRVSAWPSHVAYVFLFAGFALTFRLLDRLALYEFDAQQSTLKCVFSIMKEEAPVWVSLGLILGLIYFTHRLELLWLGLGMFVYLWAIIVFRVFSTARKIEKLESALLVAFCIGNLMLVFLCLGLLIEHWSRVLNSIDLLLAYSVPVVVLLCGLFVVTFKDLLISKWLIVLIAVVLLSSISLRHLISLFFPELALPMQVYREHPLVDTGFFGGELFVPSWHLQLRAGLLYSGVVAIPLSLLHAYLKPSRASLFLAGSASVAFLFCVSPYLFQWLRDIMDYHSSWRVAILIFTPLVLSNILVSLTDKSSSLAGSNVEK